MKKIIVYFALGAFLFSSCIFLGDDTTVYAAEKSPNYTNVTSGDITPYHEETEWRYRIVNQKLQKRLWSLTYGKWLTDWEWVNP